MDELRGPGPVRAEGTLPVRAGILEPSPSRSKAGRGLVQALFEVRDRRAEVGMSGQMLFLVRRRTSG